MRNPVLYFAAATLAPVPLLLAAALFGGLWVLLGLLYMALFSFAMDELGGPVVPLADDADLPDADRLSVALAVVHFALLPVGLLAIAGATGLGWLESLGVILAIGLWLGQISNSNAHELIHRTDKRLFRLGTWVYISLLFGHHTSSHRLVHHRFVATDEDPHTAALNETFYEFAPRAWIEGFRAGYEMEQAISGRMMTRVGSARRFNPYFAYVGGAAGLCLAVLILLGPAGLIGYLLIAAFSQTQLLLTDYVQHYGLTRRRLSGGTVEPLSPVHSWNAPHWFSGLMLLNAPRHSDHHTNPSRPYPALHLPPLNSAPTLPFSLPVMAAIAMIPPVWKRLMNPRAKAWRDVTAVAVPQPAQVLPG